MMEFKKVHEDHRRTIFANDSFLSNNKEISMIHLKKGKALGGCIHDEDEIMFILKGSVLCNFGEGWELKKEGFGSVIPAGTPHAFMAPMFDCIILESGITSEDKKNTEKDYVLEREVNNINGKD